MRRTRHVVLPVRSWQYIGLLLVSLACVTFGLVARDREGQAGSLTGPELLHRAPHDVDVCPNLDPFKKPPTCLDSLEKLNPVSKNIEERKAQSGIVRIERRRSIESITSTNRLPERRQKSLSEQRRSSERSLEQSANRFSRSLERMDTRIRNVRSANRQSPKPEIQTPARRLARDFTDRTRRSRTSNDRSRSMERREEREIERRVSENRDLRERRERFDIAARRTISARNIENREIRGNERVRDTVRSIREKRDSDRERTRDRRSNSVERRESRLEDRERTRDRRSNSVERRESRLEDRERTRDRRSNSVERRESRLQNQERTRDRRSISGERKNSFNRERRSSNIDTERRNSRIDVSNRERRSLNIRDRSQARRTLEQIRTNDRQRERESIRLTDRRDIERRNSRSEIRDIRNVRDVRSRSQERLYSGNRHEDRRLDRRAIEVLDRRSRSIDRLDSNRLDRERRFGLERRISTERRISENLNRREDQRLNRRTTDLESLKLLDRRSRSLDRRTETRLDRERRLNLERRISTERRISENQNRREDQRLNRKTIDLESHKLLDRRSRSLDRRTENRLDRERRLDLERRISTVRASTNLNRRENRREFVNRLSRSRITINRDFRGEIDRSRFDRSSGSSHVSKDREERRKIFLSRGSLERRSSDSTDRREIDTLRRTVRSISLENRESPRIARYSSDPSLDRTRNERTESREQRLTRERINDDYRLRRSRDNREFYPSRQEKRLSRSSETLNRSNSMERRESFENRRVRTDNERRSTVLSTERRERQQKEPLTRAMLRTNDLRERRSSNARIQERFVGKIERNTDNQRRFSGSDSVGKIERLMESRSRDQRRNIRSNLTTKRSLERRNSDSRIRYTASRVDLEKAFKTIDRSRDKTDRRSSYRRLVDLRQSDSPRNKIRTSELSTRIRNTLIVPSIDRDRSSSIRDRSIERNGQFLDLDRRVRKITQDFRNDEYGRKVGIISSFLKTNTLPNYDLTFEVIRQAFVIAICIAYGLSMSKSKKLFTGNLMDRINRFALR